MSESYGEIQKLIEAYKSALAEASRAAGEALDALQKADTLDKSNERNIFRKQAERSLTVSENWRVAAENLRQVLSQSKD